MSGREVESANIVAAGVIAVEVRIDDETDRLISDSFQCIFSANRAY
jgi:hypothetical protein